MIQSSTFSPKLSMGEPFFTIRGTGYFAAGGLNEPFGIDELDIADGNHALPDHFLSDALADLLAFDGIHGGNFCDDRYQFCAFLAIRHAKDDRPTRMNAWQLVDDSFDVLGINVLASINDQIFAAANDVNFPIR